jgi:hypothetical protein
MRRKHNYAPHGRYGDGGKVRVPRPYEATGSAINDAVRAVRQYTTAGNTEKEVQERAKLARADGGKVKGK